MSPDSAPAARLDRATGAVVLDGMPAQELWEGHHVLWLPLEQALHAALKSTDRNTILDCHIGTGYPASFMTGIRRIAAASRPCDDPNPISLDELATTTRPLVESTAEPPD